MPEDLKQFTPRGNNEKINLEPILRAARKALARGDGWDIEQRHYDRLRTDCEALGVAGNCHSITIALREAFAEIKSDQLRCREDPSYAGLSAGQTLYDCRWQSNRFSTTMYMKFALNDERIEIFTFHKDH